MVTGIAVIALVVFSVGALTHFDAGSLNDIQVDGQAFGANSWLPYGLLGIWAAFPFGMWFFLGIEGVPLAAEETRDPVRTMPRAMAAAIGVLLLLALLPAVGAAGSDAIKGADHPLVAALEAATGGDPTVLSRLNYAGSRRLFALSRADYLPRFLSLTSRRKAPYLGLVAPARPASRSPRLPATAPGCCTSPFSGRRCRTC